MRMMFVILLLFVAFPAMAKTYGARSVCTTMVEYQPDADVNYHPGMQVQGEFDVPVNIENSLQPTLDVIKIPVTVDLAKAFGINVPAGVELKPDVAMIEVYQDGRITYNGQDISSKVKDYCDYTPPAGVYNSDVIEGQLDVIERK